jgi:GTPase
MKVGQIAIVGRPNVGKSTLVNHLIGQKVSIVSDKPQTTRQRVRGVLTTETAQFVFVDTPGFQTKYKSALNSTMNRYVTQAFADVDVIVLVVEVMKWSAEDDAVLALFPESPNTLLAINKVDKLEDKTLLHGYLEMVSKKRNFAAFVPVSAQKGTQLKNLLGEIESRLPEGELLFEADALTDRNEKFLAAELIREKVFRQLGDEIPYGCTVIIEKFEQEGNLRRIFASILVDNENHKPMLIGKSGERMKKIATAAREDMQTLFNGPIYLEVFVKVRSGWANSQESLRRLGYET